MASLPLHRTIKVLCLLLVFLTYLLVYVIQNSIITTTVIIKKSRGAGGRFPEKIMGSSLETLFHNLNVSQCAEDVVVQQQESSGFWKPLPPQESSSADVELHSAFLDERTEYQNVKFKFVRILGVQKGRKKLPFYCHYENNISVEANYHEIWVLAWHPNPPEDFYHSIMIHCPIPLDYPTEVVLNKVMVTHQPCDKKNGVVLRIANTSQQLSREENIQDFCVCVKPLDFPNQPKLATRLIEWIESNRLLGAEKIVIYLYSVHEDVKKVLSYYESIGLVKVISWELPGHLPNDPETRSQLLHSNTWQRRRLEVLPYNHCLYENLNRFRFVVPIDIDEIIFPVNHTDWKALLDRVFYKQSGLLNQVASFSAQNVYFFKDWSEAAVEINSTSKATSNNPSSWPSLFELTVRSRNYSHVGHSVKSFVNTRVAMSLFNHYALGVLYPNQKFVLNLKTEMVQLNHYKDNCFASLKREQCQLDFLPYKVFDDRFSKRFGPRVIEQREKVVRTLGMHHQSPLKPA